MCTIVVLSPPELATWPVAVQVLCNESAAYFRILVVAMAALLYTANGVGVSRGRHGDGLSFRRMFSNGADQTRAHGGRRWRRGAGTHEIRSSSSHTRIPLLASREQHG